MADPANQPADHSPRLVWLVRVVQIGTLGLALALWFILQPQDLKSIAGSEPVLKGTVVRDLKTVLTNSLQRGYPVTLTEAEINRWLGRTVIPRQGGLLGRYAPLERVLVRLEKDQAEVVMVRKLFGQPFTVSIYLRIEQLESAAGVQTEVQLHGGPYFQTNLPLPPRGGRFGSLVVPQGFLLLVMPAYQKLADACQEEISLAFQDMARSRIEKGRIILNPRVSGTPPPAALPF